jgi:hypothetical protein
MLTFLALAQARHHDLQREAAELRQLRAARAGGPAPLEPPVPGPRARTGDGSILAGLKTLSRAKDNGTPQPC